MNILDKIVEQKKLEVAARKKETPIAALEKSEGLKREVLSLKQALLREDATGIIAEFKRRSPSKGLINGTADVVDVTRGYANGGASALSVLTDETFFGGSADDLRKARINAVPILRKDFIIDAYQLLEARAMGADVILLIAACLSPADVKRLASAAKSLGLEVLLEIHSEDELKHICGDCDVVGVNNRDLKTFTVDINTSLSLAEKIGSRVKISESGISDVKNIELLRAAGFNGFLIGENFMKQDDPAIAFASFVNRLKPAVANNSGRGKNL
jgi:indole-3-glycerol phosphate synthase